MKPIKSFFQKWFFLNRFFVGIIGMVVLLFSFHNCIAQNYAGTDFRVSFLRNLPPPYNGPPTFYFSGFAIEDAEIEISYSIPGYPEHEVIELNVLAGEHFSASFDSLFLNQYDLNIKQFRSFHVSSTGIIRLYATHYRLFFSEATAVLPTNELGADYMVVSKKAVVVGALTTLSGESLANIIGTEDSSLVRIIPSVDIPLGNASDTIELHLDAGEVITVSSFLPANNSGSNDLTGTRIFTPNGEKIAVFGGHTLTDLVCSESSHLFEQMLPLSYWGKDFPLIPAGGSLDLLRIVAYRDSTHIFFGCDYQTTLNAGEYYETLIGETTILHSTKPTLPVMFKTGFDCNQMGDPNMRMILPVTRGNNRVMFSQLVEFQSIFGYTVEYYYIHLVSRADDASNVLLNGIAVTDWVPFDDDPEMVYSTPLLEGPMITYTVESITPFWCEYVALGPFDAITMSLGCDTEIEYSPFQPGYVFLGSDVNLCQGDTISLTADYQGDFTWGDGSQNSYLSVNEAGIYTAESSGECGIFSDTIIVIPGVEPIINWGEGITACEGDTLMLLPNDLEVYDSYLWNTGETLATISVTQTGAYHVQIWSVDGCNTQDSIDVFFANYQEFTLMGPDTICHGNPQTLYTSVENETITWNTGEIGTSIIIDGGGTYTATLTTEHGCQTTDSIYVISIDEPVLMVNDMFLCIGNTLRYVPFSPNATLTWPGFSDNDTLEISLGGTYVAVATNFCGSVELPVIIAAEHCDCLIDVPNVFTPNGDFKNDIFLPLFKCEDSYYHLTVYNRWGNLIFSNEYPAEIGWDGKIQNGRVDDASEGVYTYILEYSNTLLDSKEIVFRRGVVTLLR